MARIEKDFLGEKELPDTAYYGVQTLRGKENFHITGIPMSRSPASSRRSGMSRRPRRSPTATSACSTPRLPTRSFAPATG
jgi:hypothetical protein